MDEDKTNEEGKEEEPAKAEVAGDKYETTPVIERAREEREKLELANKKTEELLDRQERIMAKRELGGMSEAGQEAKQVSPENKKINNAKEFFKDTALGDAIKRANE